MNLYGIITNIEDVEIRDDNLNDNEIIDLRISETNFFLNKKDLYRVVRDKNINIESLYVLSLLVEKKVFEKHLNREFVNKEDRSILFTKEMYQLLCGNAKENGIFRSTLSKIYHYKEELFCLPIFRENQLHTYGIEAGEEYFDYLYEYISPDYLNDSISNLSTLVTFDMANKKMFYAQRDKVIVYKEEPEIYENFVDAILSNYDQRYEMNLLSLHNQGVYPQKRIPQKTSNFGVTIRHASKGGENIKITELRESIRWIYNWKNGKKPEKDFIELQEKNPATKYSSVEEYKKQWVKNQAFKLAASVLFTSTEKNKEINACLTFDEYVSNLKLLLNKYSQNNKSAFEKVVDLNNYAGYTGIYVLCFHNEMQIYIGQTKKCFKKRITSHFTNPQSEFDKTHAFDEISNIYVLCTTTEFIDYIEMDCIATINPSYLLNKFAGGRSIELINSNTYDAKNYILPQKAIQDVVNDIKHVKRFNEDIGS